MRARASFAAGSIRVHLGRRVQALYSLLDRHNGHWLDERREAWALRLERGYQARSPAGAQAILGNQVAGGGEKPHLEQVTAVQPCRDQLPAVLGGVQHFLITRP